MQTYIKPSRYLTAKKREELYKALSVFSEELFDGKRLPKVEVIISVRGTGLDDHIDGYCHVEEQYDNGKPREIHIEIRGNRGLDFAIKCLAHEFVHVWQMCTGRLDKMSTNYAKNINYKDQPWEIEAFELEQPLYNLYLKS